MSHHEQNDHHESHEHHEHCGSGCGCGHGKHHEHHGCGCGQNHAHAHPAGAPTVAAEVTQAQKKFLHQLNHRRALPVARFTVEDSREDDFVATALAPVFIRSAADDMATVKEAGAFLQRLEDMGLLTLDYDIPLEGYAYDEYKQSTLYAYFCETVAEAAGKEGFLGDTPVLELGSMALTEQGEQIAATHCAHEHEHHHHD